MDQTASVNQLAITYNYIYSAIFSSTGMIFCLAAAYIFLSSKSLNKTK
mgnify:CR=1 FL=1